MADDEKKPKVKVSTAKVAVKAKVVTASKKPPVLAPKRIQTAEGWKRAMMKLKRAKDAKGK